MLQSIRSRLTAALVGLAIVPLCAVGVLFSMMSYTALRQQALVEQQLQAERVGTAVESFVHELAGQMILLTKIHDVFTAGSAMDKNWLLDELLAFENRFQELRLLGSDGTELIARSRGTIVLANELKNRAEDPVFKGPFSSGQPYFGSIYLASDTGEPLMTISVPIQSPITGKTVGVFLGKARLKKIWELLASQPGRQGETIFILDDAGMVVAHPNPSVVLRRSLFTLPVNHTGFVVGLGNEQVALGVTEINLGSHPLHVVAQRLESEVLALARNTLLLITFLLLISLATATYLSIKAINTITKPLRELAAVAREIKKGDLSRQMTYDKDDEVGELSIAFNAMTARLHLSFEEMAQEIEVRKQAEAALEEHRATLRQILDTIPQAIFWKDTESVYLGCNRVFAQAAGLSDPEMVRGKTDFDLPWPKEEAKAYRAGDQQVISTTKSKLHIIEPLQRMDGNRIWIDTSKVPLRDVKGEVQGVLGVYADITEKIRAEEEKKDLEIQLRQAQKMESIGTLAGGIAHDFNNILSIIFGFTDMSMTEDDAEKRRDDLGRVYKAAERARDLVQQILTFSRKTEQQQQPLQMALLVKEVLKMLRSSIPTTIDIRQNICSNALVMADPTQIHQVVMNLCTNAYHAMLESGGVLAVSLEEVDIGPDDYDYIGLTAGRYLKLDVGDTGCGIEPELQEKIFEPYFTTKGLGEGTGMGLAVVHGIVKSHHGHISLYSEPGKGTNFHVYLPVCKQKTAIAPATTTPPVNHGSGERILLIDDEEAICTMAKSILTKNGYSVTSFSNAQHALNAFTQQPDLFDLVMTDMTMPIMTGAELAKRLLGIRNDLPIILCTGQSALIDREKALALGIRAYLTKPFTKKTLLGTIHQALHP